MPTIEPCCTPLSHLTEIFLLGLNAISSPVAGKKSLEGSSAYSLASIADPFHSISSWLYPRASPRAILNCSYTKSLPVTSSVTGCSTCNLVFTSKNQNSPVFSSTKNSTVPADSYFSFFANFIAASPIAVLISELTLDEGDSSIIF